MKQNTYMTRAMRLDDEYWATKTGIDKTVDAMIDNGIDISTACEIGAKAKKALVNPISDGERKAIRAWRTSTSETVIMNDFLWESEVAGFVYALRSAGITTFIFTNQSTALMENLHWLAAAGCRIGQLVSWEEQHSIFEETTTVMGIEIHL